MAAIRRPTSSTGTASLLAAGQIVSESTRGQRAGVEQRPLPKRERPPKRPRLRRPRELPSEARLGGGAATTLHLWKLSSLLIMITLKTEIAESLVGNSLRTRAPTAVSESARF